MTPKEAIFKRKSIRKFESKSISNEQMELIARKVKELTPLYPNIEYNIDITKKTKGMFNVKAPHYLVFGSEEKEGHLENIGFIGQQMDLFLSSIGIGSCWLGGSKPVFDDEINLPYVICMAFGDSDEPLYRDATDFKRKSLVDISIGEDTRIEAARVAPSGINAQNWYFVAKDGLIHCYRKKPNLLSGVMLNKMSYIDMGIAICHIAKVSDEFAFKKLDDVQIVKGCTYVGSVV